MNPLIDTANDQWAPRYGNPLRSFTEGTLGVDWKLDSFKQLRITRLTVKISARPKV